jgi:pyridoxal phosphate enzyme (YggS family)
MSIAGNLEMVLESINNTAKESGRDPSGIKLVAVSKTVESQRILEAVKAGVTALGENRVQEARDKTIELGSQSDPLSAGIEWHLIGNLQKNKAKTAVQIFDLIHSLDSISLADELNRQAQRIKKIQRVLVQVELSMETVKHGISEESLMGLLEKVSDMAYLKLEGLMTMPPFFDDPEETRPYFRKLRKIAEKVSRKGFPVIDLSMGMTNDFQIAIEEGATILRIGTAIFGGRNNIE